MRCPLCNSALEPGIRFCGVCGHQVSDGRPPGGDVAAEAYEEVPDPYIGVVLNNRFVIESKLGEGGFGAVYGGKQLGTGRKVALKLLHPEMTQDDNLVARFRREGLVMCNLKDAHTVTTYDFDQTTEGTLFIAMELLEGRSLHDVFYAEAPIGWKRMFRIVMQMCSSLAEAHAQGIVHRDLKPENIYLESRPGEPEFVKILDFGIAKVMRGDGSQAPQLTATGQTLGTLEYMSPEQLMGKALDGRSDIYTVGVLAYELTTGRLPFPDAKGPAALITAQLREVPAPPSTVNMSARIPPAADAIILKMLAKDKADRFADMNDLRKAVGELLESGHWHGSRAGGESPAATVPGPAPVAVQAQMARPAPPAAAVAAPAQAPAPAHAQRGPAAGRGAAAGSGATLGRAWLWFVLALICVGGLVGAALALR
ncbi:serine/threonine protein kinase [Haliangium sp.]|uniref:serine/threonine protein kinase n=1 Tax=Haliangium sp. TaxID=2663208 RepID=UPI003D126E48